MCKMSCDTVFEVKKNKGSSISPWDSHRPKEFRYSASLKNCVASRRCKVALILKSPVGSCPQSRCPASSSERIGYGFCVWADMDSFKLIATMRAGTKDSPGKSDTFR